MVWFGFEGVEIVSVHLGDCRKVRSVQAARRVALSIEAGGTAGGLANYLVVYGRAPRHRGRRAPLEQEVSVMSKATYGAADTGLLVVDPYNDFLSEGGKLLV
jgi:hypothetical protein